MKKEDLQKRMQSEGHKIGKEDADLSNEIFQEEKDTEKKSNKDKDDKK